MDLGFGKATAELFAKEDQVNLILIDYNKEALAATAEVCKAAGSKVIAIPGDVTKLETFELALKEALENFGKVDFLSIMREAHSRWHPLKRWTMRRTAELST